MSIPLSISIGPLDLITRPLKTSLQALASNWKVQFTSFLHDMAKESLNSVVQDRDAMYRTLSSPVSVGDLSFLREVLELLLHIDDMFHYIDNVYTPVEDMYQLLRYIHM